MRISKTLGKQTKKRNLTIEKVDVSTTELIGY